MTDTQPLTPNPPTLAERARSNAAFIRFALRCGEQLLAGELAAVANTLDAAAEGIETADAEAGDGRKAMQLIADVLAERHDELDQAACDRCTECGTVVMCGFHSVLSALQRQTFTAKQFQRLKDEAEARKDV